MALYEIVGRDGEEYGPYTVDEVRHYKGQGYFDDRSLVRKQGEGEQWHALRTFEELLEVPPVLQAPSVTVQPPPTAVVSQGENSVPEKKKNPWLIVGIVAGAVALLAVIVVVVLVIIGSSDEGSLSELPVLSEVSENHDQSETGLYELGRKYLTGQGEPKDYKKAMQLFLEAAEKGDSRAMHALGNIYDFGEVIAEDDAEAMKWYRKAADKGHSVSQYCVGYGYFYGEGVSKDVFEAVKWFRKAADQGNSSAQYEVGRAYYFGTGVLKSYPESAKWYLKAADQGHTKAEFGLGLAYASGEGVFLNYKEAEKWYRKAAQKGHVGSLNNLGKMFSDGRLGQSGKYSAAYMLFKVAAVLGSEIGAENLPIVAQYLTVDQKRQGDAAASQLLQKIRENK